MSKPEKGRSAKLTTLGEFVDRIYDLSGAKKAGKIVDRMALSMMSREPLPGTRIGEARNSGILYSDRNSKLMLKRRKRMFWFFFSLSAFFLAISATMCTSALYYYSSRPFWDQIWALLLAPGLFLLTFVFIDFMLMDERNALRFGFVLTTDRLSLRGTETIPIDDILRASVVTISGNWGRFLAVDFRTSKKGRSDVRSILIQEHDTEDIYQLRDAIREIKKWGGEAQLMPEFVRWKDWRDSARKLVYISS